MLCAAKSDALCAEMHCICCICRRIRIGAYLKNAVLVRPVHDALEVTGNGSLYRRDISQINLTGGAIQRNIISLAYGMSAKLEELLLLVDSHITAAGDAAGSHSAGNNRCVRGHSSAHGQNALCGMHAVDVLRRGLLTNKDHAVSCSVCGDRILSIEIHTSCRCSRRCRKSLADFTCILKLLCVKTGMKQLIQGLRLDAGYRGLLIDHPLVYKIAGNLDGSLCGSLSVSCLQEEELAVLDRELHILHILVVILQLVRNRKELLIALGKILSELRNRLRRADACHNVLALCIDQILTEDALCAGCGVSRESNAGAGGIAHVAEYHRLNVDSGSQLIGNVIHAAVGIRSRVVPGAEHCLDCFHQLHAGILRELIPLLLLIELLVLSDDILKILCCQLGIEFIAVPALLSFQDGVEKSLRLSHNDIGEHLDKSPVRVISKSRISGLLCKADNGNIVQSEVQDCIHHSGHGNRSAGTYRNQKRIVLITELLAADFFQPGQSIENLLLRVLINLLAVIVVIRAGFR